MAGDALTSLKKMFVFVATSRIPRKYGVVSKLQMMQQSLCFALGYASFSPVTPPPLPRLLK